MQLDHLLNEIDQIEPFLPRCRNMEVAIGVGVGLGQAVYASQKQHWQEWLVEYAQPGAHGRSGVLPRTAKFVYSRIMCPPMLYWLCEGVGVRDADLDRAYDAVLAAKPFPASRCAALRTAIPWEKIEVALRFGRVRDVMPAGPSA